MSHAQRGSALPVVVVGAIVVWYVTTHSGGSAAETAPATTAQVQQWVAQADGIVTAHDPQLAGGLNDTDTELIIAHESSNRTDAVNHTDINAQQHNPSEGLMQTTIKTFNSHCVPGYCGNIFDPVSNIAAGEVYAIETYGSLAKTPGPASIAAGGPYRPY